MGWDPPGPGTAQLSIPPTTGQEPGLGLGDPSSSLSSLQPSVLEGRGTPRLKDSAHQKPSPEPEAGPEAAELEDASLPYLS